jgi:cysteinyl-tRNA synthetase
MGHAKMAGSVGNVVNIVDLLQRHHPETVRFLLLNTHYRTPIEYSDERLNEVRRGLDAFYRFFERFERITGKSFFDLEFPTKLADSSLVGPNESGPDDRIAWLARNYGRSFLEHMDDDFNTGGAVAWLHGLVNLFNHQAGKWLEKETRAAPELYEDFISGVKILRELSNILGLFWEPVASPKAGSLVLFAKLRQVATDLGAAPAADLDGVMEQLIQMRADARKAKNFAVADQIRKRLAELNVTLEDRPGGKTDWRLG